LPGKVYLVGAGPGDPELLTLKAARALAAADIVLVDNLVHRGALIHSPQARVIEVGKRGGCKSTPQAFITRLMIRYARQGKTVVRLKGGDPFVFGRGGEEYLSVREAGIACEVVSGVSAGFAAPAAAGIPVTHRGVANSVTFVTGHGAGEKAIDWKALAASRATLVIFMGLAHAREIAEELMAGGLSPDIPAACIAQATLDTQNQIVTTLGHLADAVRDVDLLGPATLIVGAVVALADTAYLAASSPMLLKSA
jgi:uroporphyrin-III C-methyltransferase